MFRRTACCLLLILLAAPAMAEPPLVWKFEPGQQLRYQVVQKTDSNINAGESGVVQTNMVQTMDLVWNVEQILDDGAARVRVDVERVQMELAAPLGQGFSYDTAAPDTLEGMAALLAPTFDAMVEHGFSVTVRPGGELSDIEAADELLNAAKNLPGAAGGNAAEQSLKGAAMPVATPVPGREVEVGAEWTRNSGDINVALFGALKLEGSYRYDGPSEDQPGISLITPSLSVSATSPEGGPMTGGVKTASSGGKVLFNHEAGRLESSETNHTMEMTISIGESTISGTIAQSSVVSYGAKSNPPSEASATILPVGTTP